MIWSSCPQDDKMTVSIRMMTLDDSINMEDDSIDMEDDSFDMEDDNIDMGYLVTLPAHSDALNT